MDVNACRKDFAYIRNIIRDIHPRFCIEPIGEIWEEYACREEQTVIDVVSLLHAAGRLTAWLKDGHTNLELPFEETPYSDCLNFSCSWQERTDEKNHLLLRSDAGGLQRNDELLSINGMPMEELFQRICGEIPHENISLARARSVGYPYANYFLFSGFHLRQQIGPPPYPLAYLRNGRQKETKMSLLPYCGGADFHRSETSFAFRGKTAILLLDECIVDPEIIRLLQEFFTQVAVRRCKRVILDLSRNLGGNSGIIEVLLQYLPVKQYRLYGMLTREPSGKLIERCPRASSCPAGNNSPIFTGELIVVVSQQTFSSARTMAVTLKDNGLAKIAGTTMGGVPNSYGLPRRFQTPEGNFRFRVSTSLFLRPDQAKDQETVLPMDIPLPSGWDWEGNRIDCLSKALGI